MAVYQEIFERRDYSLNGEHTCAQGQAKNPLSECWRCRDDRVSVQVGDKTYLNPHGGRVEQAPNGLVYSVTHEGLVVATRERNYPDDSDFYAIVWDPETKSLGEVTYGTTRFGGTDHNFARKDLDPMYEPDLREHYVQVTMAAIEDQERQAWREAAFDVLRPSKGKTLKVVAGRKVPVGTVGLCIWAGESQFGDRVGIVVAGYPDPLWTATRNVKVLIGDADDLPYLEDFLTSPAARRTRAEEIVDARFASMHRGAWVIS